MNKPITRLLKPNKTEEFEEFAVLDFENFGVLQVNHTITYDNIVYRIIEIHHIIQSRLCEWTIDVQCREIECE